MNYLNVFHNLTFMGRKISNLRNLKWARKTSYFYTYGKTILSACISQETHQFIPLLFNFVTLKYKGITWSFDGCHWMSIYFISQRAERLLFSAGPWRWWCTVKSLSCGSRGELCFPMLGKKWLCSDCVTITRKECVWHFAPK